ncbi:hypothetical protein DFH09DRAFT_1294853 [Mycena vulgaris]|nr:hypothetical protein DFH09DRAFT_1294853 [Mycena vulgaris]
MAQPSEATVATDLEFEDKGRSEEFYWVAFIHTIPCLDGIWERPGSKGIVPAPQCHTGAGTIVNNMLLIAMLLTYSSVALIRMYGDGLGAFLRRLDDPSPDQEEGDGAVARVSPFAFTADIGSVGLPGRTVGGSKGRSTYQNSSADLRRRTLPRLI